MVYNRSESFVGHVKRHPSRMWYRHEADANGRLGVVAPHGPEYDVTDLYTAVLEYANGLTVHYTDGCINPCPFIFSVSALHGS